jgi:hypothetical protein
VILHLFDEDNILSFMFPIVSQYQSMINSTISDPVQQCDAYKADASILRNVLRFKQRASRK